jgi:hypothetical protein
MQFRVASPRRAQTSFISGWATFLLFVCPAVADDTASKTGWKYVDRDLTVVIRRIGAGEWIAERNDGKNPAYREVERSDEHVVLQNKDTKLFIRLTADRAYWRRPADAEWTTWVKGNWIAAPPCEDPSNSKTRRIQLAYFVPRDRRPTADYERKIRVVMAVVADLYRTDLQSKGYKTTGLQFESMSGAPRIQLVKGERDARHYNNAPAYDADEQWKRLLPEIRSKIGDTKKRIAVVFVENYDDGPAEHLWPGVMARGAYFSAEGGLAVFSAHLLRDEFSAATPAALRELFLDQTPVPGRKAWGRSMNSPRGAIAEAGVGAVAHELGHALGLPHDRRDDSRDIMGNGFRNLRWNSGGGGRRVSFSEENARLLMSSRYLNDELDLTDDQPPTVEAKFAGARGTITVKASDDRGLRAYVLVDRTKGSVVAGGTLKGTTAEFKEARPNGGGKSPSQTFQLIVSDSGGHQTRINVGAAKSKKK